MDAECHFPDISNEERLLFVMEVYSRLEAHEL